MRPLRKTGSDDPRDRLRLLLADEELDVAEAALWIAKEEYPELDVPFERGRLRNLALAGAERAARHENPFARLDEVQTYLYEELGFRGNAESYDDPRNSFLNDVLELRTGIPLTLSVVFLEIAREAGFEVRGIGLPGHFVARVSLRGRTILVDPYHRARVITRDDCRDLVARSTGRPSLFRPEQLDGVAGRSMVGRLLLNLKHVYVNKGDYAKALGVVERLLMVSPENTRELRDRGFLQAHLGHSNEAIRDLERYLRLAPKAADFESVKGRVAWLRRKLSRAN